MNYITLSSVPTRFDQIGPGLESLLAQHAPIDKVLLYIPDSYRRFPDWDGSLPQVPAGVEIRRPGPDLGPATKVLYAIREFQGQDCNIIFCDDDRVFAPDWAQALLATARDHPGCAVAISSFDVEDAGALGPAERTRQPRAQLNHKSRSGKYRLRRIAQQLDVLGLFTSRYKPARRPLRSSGYSDVFEGAGGVLVRPEFFDDDVFDIPQTLWSVDDVWLSGHVARMGVPIWGTADIDIPFETDLHGHTPLYQATIEGLGRNDANRACIKYFQDTYKIWC